MFLDLGDEEIFQLLGGAAISPHNIPAFSYDKNELACGALFYAFLKNNENWGKVVTELGELNLKGCYAGIGFGASFRCLDLFFSTEFQGGVCCDREPYVYLMGKLFLSLVDVAASAEDLFLSLVDYETFHWMYQQAIKKEFAGSPIFLRQPRDDLLAAIPPAIEQLRRGMFSNRFNKLSAHERKLFTEGSEASVNEKLSWVRHFLNYKSHWEVLGFRERFIALQEKCRKVVPLCADFFHPALWKFLGSHDLVWQEPGIIYFSNAAIYSSGQNIRSEEFSTTTPFQPEVFDRIPGVSAGRHLFLYAEQRKNYEVQYSRQLPSDEDLTGSFAAKKKCDADSLLPPIPLPVDTKKPETADLGTVDVSSDSFTKLASPRSGKTVPFRLSLRPGRR
jgi:hypothetical protein